MLSKMKKGEGMERRRGTWILEVGRKVHSMDGQDPHFLAVLAPARVHRVSRAPLPWTEKRSGLWSMRTGVKTAKGPEAVSSSEALSWV